jgi:tellurite resistance protein
MKGINTTSNPKSNYKANDNEENENNGASSRALYKESMNNALLDKRQAFKKPPAYDFSKCYTSPFLSKTVKPTKDSLKLASELELLKPLILSQQVVFTQPIIDLGIINLNSTKALTKEQESLKLLQSDNKIPRSLRIKCKLITSPDFADHPGFLQFKSQLQQEVAGFIARGTKMTRWTELHTQLLNLDRCTSILGKALQILEGLTYLFTNIFGTPLWPYVEDKLIPLFLFKYYISNSYIDTTEVTDFLGLSPKDPLLLGAKPLTNAQTDEDTSAIITSLKLSDIDLEEEVDEAFVSEILAGFDQILRFTTIGVWHCYHDITRQTITAAKLKARMQSLETTKATMATAQAIAKATNNLESNQKLTANTNLRISNLEKSMARQEEKANEIINRLKSNHQQKNSKGSHLPESMASPEQMTPSTQEVQCTIPNKMLQNAL